MNMQFLREDNIFLTHTDLKYYTQIDFKSDKFQENQHYNLNKTDLWSPATILSKR